MKKKMVLRAIMLALFVLQSETVFANSDFADKFAANDIAGIETLLREYGHQMDLQICLNSVSHSLAWITLGENPYDLMETALPLNRNRNSIFKAIQLLVANGVDLNQNRHEGLYTGKVGGGWSYYYTNGIFSNILYWSIRGNSQPNMAIIRFLLESGADPNSNVYLYNQPEDILFIAIGQGNAALVKLLVEAGCKVDQYKDVGLFRDSGIKTYHRIPQDSYIGDLSALQFATYFGEYAIVRTLVDAGAKINYTQKSDYHLARKTATVIARERGETDIYNYLMSSQVASTPPPSSNTYTPPPPSSSYTPPPSSSSSSSSSSSNTARDVIDTINRTFESPLENGRYRVSGGAMELSFAGIARAGNVSYKDAAGTTHRGTYSIDGTRLTINVMGRSYFYNINNKTSFSGNGESWFRTGF